MPTRMKVLFCIKMLIKKDACARERECHAHGWIHIVFISLWINLDHKYIAMQAFSKTFEATEKDIIFVSKFNKIINTSCEL